MQSRTCPGTPQQGHGIAAESFLSPARLRHLKGNLAALPGLYQETLHHISPVSRQMHQTRVSGSRNTDQLSMSALDARQNILAILESWADLVVDKHGGEILTRSVPHLTYFLMRNLGWLTAQPQAADFADEIDGLRLELLRTIDPEPAEPDLLTWDCVVAGCGGKITTPTQHVGNSDGKSVRCSSGHTWEIHEWITLRPLMARQGKAARP
ncbi:putative ovmZ homologue [Actinacidiphila reveromycinica]|uniref:Putative ovmZ homologue n=1 Tax=Actinacidiphila reveromycinica TaxID=659352 RepID=A0A7U3UT08_9ACTN|nr:hypothetical protein [Streptomyces sp. SN-593]BBA98086.1 putative ovmZ homologue [Streptomyces sp. SN-593]